jgi:hypothetical protein
MSESKQGLGQHRGDGQPASNNGQRNIRGTAGDVGQPSGGEKNNGPVPASRPGADIITTTGSAGERSPSERGPSVDAKR